VDSPVVCDVLQSSHVGNTGSIPVGTTSKVNHLHFSNFLAGRFWVAYSERHGIYGPQCRVELRNTFIAVSTWGVLAFYWDNFDRG